MHPKEIFSIVLQLWKISAVFADFQSSSRTFHSSKTLTISLHFITENFIEIRLAIFELISIIQRLEVPKGLPHSGVPSLDYLMLFLDTYLVLDSG